MKFGKLFLTICKHLPAPHWQMQLQQYNKISNKVPELASEVWNFMNDNRKFMKKYSGNYKIVSLGADCMPRTYPTVYMLKPCRAAGRYIKEARCNAVKLEGGSEIVPLVEKLVKTGIPVMAHVGLMPQHIATAGGYRIAGKTEDDAERLLNEVKAFENAGAFAVVLECIPAKVAENITSNTDIPTIGIGAGAGCDGQVQVCNDLLGLFDRFVPKHAKRYCNLREIMLKAYSDYVTDVKTEKFPTEDNSF